MKENEPFRNPLDNRKPPNFVGIVIGASIVILLILVAACFLLGWDARKLLPHRSNPQPNAMVLRLPLAHLPDSREV